MTGHCDQCLAKALRIRELEAEIQRLTADPADEDVREVFEAWRTHCQHPRAQLTASKVRKIKARLREKPVVGKTRKEDLIFAIQGAAALAHTSDQGVRYDGIETIFANAEKVELNLQRYQVSRRRDGASVEQKLVSA